MKQKLKYIFLVGLVCAPCFLYAQTKPKRDTSKDRSVVVAKQQALAKRKAAEQAAAKKRREAAEEDAKRKEDAVNIQTLKTATYLLVAQQTSVTKNVSSYGESITLSVSTDGDDWDVSYLPHWCRVTKYSDFFYLSVQQNTSHDPRSDWFRVTSGSKAVRVDIKQDGAPFNITSSINSAYLTHNVVWNSLRVNANVTILGAQGQKCLIVAFIEDEKGNYIKASSAFPNYGLQSSNYLCVTKEITPTSDNLQNYNVSVDIPNNAMRLYNKKNNLRCRLSVYCVKTSTYVSNANYLLPFVAKNKKGKVTTSRM